MRATLLVAALLLATTASAADPMPPEDAIMLSVKALRSGDLQPIIDSMPAAEQEESRGNWAMVQQMPGDPQKEAQFDAMVAMLKTPEGIDALMAQAGPQLAAYNAQATAAQIGMAQMMIPAFAMQCADIPEVQQMLMAAGGMIPGIQAWVLGADFGNPDKAREALGAVSAWLKAQNISTVAELKSRSYEQIVQLAGSGCELGKDVASIYGGDIDGWLDSIQATSVPGATPDESVVTVAMTCFQKPVSFSMTLVKTADGKWQAKCKEQIQAKMQQLGGGMGGGMGGGTGGEPPAEGTAPF